MHSIQAGLIDKAQKYIDKAVAQTDKLRENFDTNPILSSFQVLLLEMVVECRLVTGNMGGTMGAFKNLSLLFNKSSPQLLLKYRSQLHIMLGLYAISMNCMPEAETQ